MKQTILFISCEHATNAVPDEFRHIFHSQEPLLKTHRGMDFGALEIATHLSQTFHCDSTIASVTRLLIDCNRSLTHPNCFSELTRELGAKDKQTVIDRYYRPYRNQAETLIKNHIEQGQQVLHISCHSFTPIFNGITRNASIGLLYDPRRHGEKEVARQWHGLLDLQTDLRVRMNYPYRGTSDGFTSSLRRQYGEKDYLGIELEVNQTLVKDKTTLNTLTQALSISLGELLQLL
ncbi:MAG: N-formylglutamate amidohydrolase [Legionellales bacterium]|nr:N-formylglutamate amidohydrolase [Legionellales bacterium]